MNFLRSGSLRRTDERKVYRFETDFEKLDPDIFSTVGTVIQVIPSVMEDRDTNLLKNYGCIQIYSVDDEYSRARLNMKKMIVPIMTQLYTGDVLSDRWMYARLKLMLSNHDLNSFPIRFGFAWRSEEDVFDWSRSVYMEIVGLDLQFYHPGSIVLVDDPFPVDASVLHEYEINLFRYHGTDNQLQVEMRVDGRTRVKYIVVNFVPGTYAFCLESLNVPPDVSSFYVNYFAIETNKVRFYLS